MTGLLLIAATMMAFDAGTRLQRRFGGSAIVNPVLVAVILNTLMLKVLGISGATYFEAVRPLDLLLVPATVALALPLYRSGRQIRQAIVPIIAGVLVGSILAALSAIAIAGALGAPSLLLRSVATKSATAAIAMSVGQAIGGDPQLAGAFSVLTGIVGAIMCVPVLDLFGVHDPRARGIATGVTAHGIGTARILAESPEAGAFFGLAMGLAGFLAGVLVPTAARWLTTALQ